MIYLDSAATSFLKPQSVSRAVAAALSSMASPGRGAYRAAMLAADKVFECRTLVARLFNVPEPERVVFTMNATHGLNIAIRSLAGSGSRVLVSGYEHNSVTRVVNAIGAQMLCASSPLFDQDAAAEAFAERINQADLVVCNQVSNVFGFILPVERIAKLCKERSVPLIVDASQSAGVRNVDFQRLGAAFIAMPGHKGLLGPQGTGVLLCADGAKPLLAGGTGSDSKLQNMPDYLPDRLEAGTHNVPGISGLAEGVRFVLGRGAETIGAHESRLCGVMASKLRRIEGMEVFSSGNGTQSGVLSVRHAAMDAEALCSSLSRAGIAARCGFHCAPLAHQTAGTDDTGTVRFSFSPFTSENDVISAARACEKIIRSQNS